MLCIEMSQIKKKVDVLCFVGMRHPYHGIDTTFDLEDLKSGDPMKQFEAWFEDARKVKEIQEANAMALATASK